MYSAHCWRPWGASQTDQDDDQDLTQLRRERGSHRGKREERGGQDYSCPNSSMPSHLPPITLPLPPSHCPPYTPPPHLPRTREEGEGAASQLTHLIRR